MSFDRIPEILTSRLALIAITPETLQSERDGNDLPRQWIRCIVPANWPPADWEPHVFEMLLAQFVP